MSIVDILEAVFSLEYRLDLPLTDGLSLIMTRRDGPGDDAYLLLRSNGTSACSHFIQGSYDKEGMGGRPLAIARILGLTQECNDHSRKRILSLVSQASQNDRDRAELYGLKCGIIGWAPKTITKEQMCNYRNDLAVRQWNWYMTHALAVTSVSNLQFFQEELFRDKLPLRVTAHQLSLFYQSINQCAENAFTMVDKVASDISAKLGIDEEVKYSLYPTGSQDSF
ncbi:TPA: hypothetical protein HA265_04970 [Candidatus Woesearchaeota archaeon]|nr:hypothetical protein [Candidatus Woesearchaeota archaeon]